jgi:Fe-S cluster biogenesis protein NfuA/nitrite reductase/ring-hydroxylating ferredoxin subunit
VDDAEAREQVARVETLLEQVESLGDSAAREVATESMGALLELYGEGLARIVGGLGANGAVQALAEDELVSHLLLLHGLHPVPVEERVHGALEEVRPYLRSHGGNVELLGVEEGVVHLRLEGSCSGCPSSAMTLKLAIEDAIHKAAPDIERVEADGTVEPPSPVIQLQVAGGGRRREESPDAEPDGSWATAGGLPQLSGGGTVLKEVSGEQVLFLNLDGTFYAYRPDCPNCEDSLERASLRAGELTCGGCGHRYDVLRAGRCLDAPELRLTPIPLLTDAGGLVKVAVGSAVA